MSEDPIVGLRENLARWNLQLRDWEAKLATTEGGLLEAYEGELAEWRIQLERAAERLRQLSASSAAGASHARDVEAELAKTAEVFQRVRSRLGRNF
jgi:hypothetical protein